MQFQAGEESPPLDVGAGCTSYGLRYCLRHNKENIVMATEQAEKTACTKQELARALRVSMGTVSKWNRAGCPRFYVGVTHGKGSRPRYYLEQVKAWLASRAAADGKEMAV